MLSSVLSTLSSRRHALGLIAGASMAPFAARQALSMGHESAVSRDDILPDVPQAHLDLFRRMSASAADGEQTILRYSGVTFGMVDGTNAIPLYGMEGVSPVRSYKQADGSVKFFAREVAVHTDLKTGEVIDSWFNPFLDKPVDVWHLRNGPLSYGIDPTVPLDTAGWRLLVEADVEGPPGFYLPAHLENDALIVTLDAQARRPNPLKPAEWPNESSGETLVYSEHNTWRANASDVANPDLPSLPIFAAWHSHKMWRPWMLMGQRPGHIYNHLYARKIESMNQVPAKILDYLEAHFSEFLEAPGPETTGYKDNWSHFMEKRTPQ